MLKRSRELHNKLKKKVLEDPIGRAEYEAFKLELELALQLKSAREKANLSQEEVAVQMKTKKPAIARLEAAGGREKHSPSLRTLLKYANAIGYELCIKLVRKKKHAM